MTCAYPVGEYVACFSAQIQNARNICCLRSHCQVMCQLIVIWVRISGEISLTFRNVVRS